MTTEHEDSENKPAPGDGGILARLIAEGRVRPAQGNLSEWLDQHPPAAAEPGQRPLSEVLDELREDRL